MRRLTSVRVLAGTWAIRRARRRISSFSWTDSWEKRRPRSTRAWLAFRNGSTSEGKNPT
jgi:hypothetical protein